MIPDHALSSSVVRYKFILPPNKKRHDYEFGGVAIGNSSQGLNVQIWQAFYEGGSIKVQPVNGAAITVLVVVGVTELSFAFDQNMRPVFAYVAQGLPYLYWFDSFAAMFVITPLPIDAINPKLSLDDNRSSQTASNDVILAYLRNGQLFMRVQRERYQIERYLSDVPAKARLRQIGMSKGLRFQFFIQ